MNKRSLKNMSMSNRLFYIFNSVFWIIVMFITLYPLYLVVISSISDPEAILLGKVLWRPVDVSWIGYQSIIKNAELWISYGNSLVYTIVGVCISIIVTLCAAYVLSRRSFLGKGVINLYFVITMFFSGGLIPTFLIMKDIGLYNNRWVIILTGCVSVWNMMVARTYIQTSIPDDLYEAAVLDGAGHFQYFFKVVMPLSKTIVAVLAVYYGVAKWNDYFTGMVYIKDRNKMPLQTVLKTMLAALQNMTGMDDSLAAAEELEMIERALRVATVSKYCLIVVSTVPVVMLYIILQKYFEKGVMIGALKG